MTVIMRSLLRDQGELIAQLGSLLRPVQEAIDQGGDRRAFSKAFAKLAADRQVFLNAVTQFGKSETGHNYEFELRLILRVLVRLQTEVEADGYATAEAKLAACRAAVIENIHAIQMEVPSTVFAARSPFSCYCGIKALVASSQAKLTIVDPYLDETVFYRYLNDLPARVMVTLVGTQSQTVNAPAFIDISRIFAAERGPAGYRLVTHSKKSLHDRWIRTDDTVSTLGGSLKDAGKDSECTLSTPDPSPGTLKLVDEKETNGAEHFGPARPAHP